jgi:hypothetical protein
MKRTLASPRLASTRSPLQDAHAAAGDPKVHAIMPKKEKIKVQPALPPTPLPMTRARSLSRDNRGATWSSLKHRAPD